jgi:hypothetical protein
MLKLPLLATPEYNSYLQRLACYAMHSDEFILELHSRSAPLLHLNPSWLKNWYRFGNEINTGTGGLSYYKEIHPMPLMLQDITFSNHGTIKLLTNYKTSKKRILDVIIFDTKYGKIFTCAKHYFPLKRVAEYELTGEHNKYQKSSFIIWLPSDIRNTGGITDTVWKEWLESYNLGVDNESAL